MLPSFAHVKLKLPKACKLLHKTMIIYPRIFTKASNAVSVSIPQGHLIARKNTILGVRKIIDVYVF